MGELLFRFLEIVCTVAGGAVMLFLVCFQVGYPAVLLYRVVRRWIGRGNDD